jgi:uncharacterized protein (TIGR03000 family)
MQRYNQAICPVLLLASVALFSIHSSAQAQILSRWGNPVVTFGWSPYDWDETGLGHYYGRPRYSPVPGYHVGNFARPPFHAMTEQNGIPGRLESLQLTPAVPPEAAALVIVRLPAEAELWFDETKTTQSGSYRRFVTPPLQTGRLLTYTLRAHWHIQDADLTRTEKVRVEPNKSTTVNLLTVDGWSGVRPETLPQPRKAP